MQPKPPRRQRSTAAPLDTPPHEASAEDDPWAGDDAAWSEADSAGSPPTDDLLGPSRGIALGLLVALVLWSLAAVLIWQLL
jgi:hypothetical protein